MRECKSCINRECKDKLVCCAANQLREAFRELLRGAPFFRARLPEYECQAYEPDPDLFINKTLHIKGED
jgi:hypothetical protein